MIKTEGTTIKVFRGDSGHFDISKTDSEGNIEQFKQGDKVILSVKENFGEKNVLLRKTIPVNEDCDKVEFPISEEESISLTDLISEPMDFEYDVKVKGVESSTIIGHDDSGAKIFKVYPTGSVDS